VVANGFTVIVCDLERVDHLTGSLRGRPRFASRVLRLCVSVLLCRIGEAPTHSIRRSFGQPLHKIYELQPKPCSRLPNVPAAMTAASRIMIT
jgi:hypothetical protein